MDGITNKGVDTSGIILETRCDAADAVFIEEGNFLPNERTERLVANALVHALTGNAKFVNVRVLPMMQAATTRAL